MARKVFRDAAAQLALEQRLARRIVRTDWANADEVREHCREHARDLRRDTLDRLVPDRRCPCCGKTKVKSRQWCVMDRLDFKATGEEAERVRARANGSQVACCRSCVMKHFRKDWVNGKAKGREGGEETS